MNDDLVKKLSLEFTRTLSSYLTASEWATMWQRNSQEKDRNVCHSHDFCDANMAMDDAFTKVVGRHADVGRDEDADLWNKAWKMADLGHRR